MEEKMGFGLKRIERRQGQREEVKEAPRRPAVRGCPVPSRPLPLVLLIRLSTSPSFSPSKAGDGGGASTCPLLQGGARLSRGIWPSRWPRAIVGRVLPFGAPAAASGRGVGRVGQAGVAQGGKGGQRKG